MVTKLPECPVCKAKPGEHCNTERVRPDYPGVHPSDYVREGQHHLRLCLAEKGSPFDLTPVQGQPGVFWDKDGNIHRLFTPEDARTAKAFEAEDKSLPKERIAAAAIVYDGVVWTLPPPARHHHIIHAHAQVTGDGGSGDGPGTKGQGFVTSGGRFVSREEALVIASDAGQLLKPKGHLSGLYSEDVW